MPSPRVVGSVFALLALGLSACAAPSNPSAPSPSPSASPSPQASTPATSEPVPADRELGPDGVAGLKLGMTKVEAQASGEADDITGTSGTCGQVGDGRLSGAVPVDATDLDGKLFFSENTGKLVIIGATSGIATPEGIHLGSSYAEVKKAYPSWKGSEGKQGLGWVKVPGNASAFYRIYIDADQVLELTLQSADQDCAE